MPRSSKSRVKSVSKNRPEFIESLEVRRLLCTTQDTSEWKMTELRPDLYRQALIDQAARLLAAGPQYGVAASQIKGAKVTATTGAGTSAGKTGAKTPAVAGAADIIWTNKGTKVDSSGGTDGDGFFATFGINAAKARNVVEAVITQYERMIGSFNYGDGTSNFNLTLSMSGSGFGASTGAGTTVGGKPKSGTIQMGKGNNSSVPAGTGTDQGWFMDSTPLDNSEFMGTVVNEFAANATPGGPAVNKSDFLTVVAAEMTHTMGQFGNVNGLWNALTTSTAVSDKAASGTLYVFRGPSIKHLLTSDNGGQASSFAGVHTADPQAQLTFQGDTYSSTDDQGNAFYEQNVRYIIDNMHALMFKDAFNYATIDPALYGTMYDVLNETTHVMTIRGGDAVSGRTNSSDVISITRSGTTITVSEDIGNDVASTGALPGEGNLPAFVTQYDISNVSSIIVNSGDGNDSITIGADLGVPVSINGGGGTDTVTVTGTSAVNTINVASTGVSGDVTIAPLTSVEGLIINAGDGADVLSFDGSGTVPTTINGQIGDDALVVTHGLAASFLFDGGQGLDSITVNGSSSDESYGISSAGVTGNANLPMTSVESFTLFSNDGSDNITVDPTGFTFTNINAGAGDDTITVNNPGSSFITIDGGADNDALNVNGSSNSETFNITSAGISGSTSMTVSAVESLNLNAGDGDDAITVDSSVAIPLSIVGGPGVEFLTFTGSTGDDTYNVAADSSISGAATVSFIYGVEGLVFNMGDGGDTMNYTAGALPTTVNGAAGTDALFVIGTSADESFNVAANSVTGAALVNSISSVESLTLNAGDGADLIAYDGAGNTRPTTINGEDGSDSLTLTNANGASPVYLGGAGANVLTLSSGSYTASSDLGAGGTDMAVVVLGAGTVTFNSTQHLSELDIIGGASSKAVMSVGHSRVLSLGDLSITNNGTLDLNDTNMIVYYSGSSPIGSIVDAIHSGRNNGTWTGAGIISTSAKTRAPQNTTLGTMNSSDYTQGPTFAGETLTGDAVLVKYTYYGDTNFNGRVEGSDYAHIDLTFLNQGAGTIGGWVNGDYDGNGRIDGADYANMDLAFITQAEVL